MGYRYRWGSGMTGLPGRMRFRISPGWVGYSPYNLRPVAQYLMNGIWPTFQIDHYWQAGQIPLSVQGNFHQIPGFPAPFGPYAAVQITSEQALDVLKGQAKVLENDLNGIKKSIRELQKKDA
ncbi:MAG: hypothetical protein AYK18_08020 [Theionarchaea archaeon DG-70]|nr:MAG: hypothetical protein AYK18_08020 [Theionarchaea archaeon DG-70]